MIAAIPPPPTLTRATIETLTTRYALTMIHVAHHQTDAARGVCPGKGHVNPAAMVESACAAAGDRPVLCLVLPGARAPRGTRAVVVHVSPSGDLR